mgnify:CR=1 FL=1
MTARYRFARRFIVVAWVAFAVGGCEMASISQMIPSFPTFPSLTSVRSSSILRGLSPRDCAKVPEEDLKKVNWTQVPEVNMRVRNGEFEPMFVQLKQGWPYVFRIRNRDDDSHTFNASEFLSAMAVTRITVAGKRWEDTCVGSITVPPRETAELRLVAAIDGRYEFEDTWLPALGLGPATASGVIIVEERR